MCQITFRLDVVALFLANVSSPYWRHGTVLATMTMTTVTASWNAKHDKFVISFWLLKTQKSLRSSFVFSFATMTSSMMATRAHNPCWYETLFLLQLKRSRAISNGSGVCVSMSFRIVTLTCGGGKSKLSLSGKMTKSNSFDANSKVFGQIIIIVETHFILSVIQFKKSHLPKSNWNGAEHEHEKSNCDFGCRLFPFAGKVSRGKTYCVVSHSATFAKRESINQFEIYSFHVLRICRNN